MEENITKKKAVKKLIKHLIIFVIAIVVAASIVVGVMGDQSSIFLGIFGGLFFAGIPFGWKVASNIITAVSFIGIIFKALISMVIGWVALPITIIKDIIAVVKAGKEPEIDVTDTTAE